MTTPINIIIDNKSVIDDVETCEIAQAEGQYCNSVSLSLKSKSFWTLCDPTTNFGTLRIKVVIGDTTYQFLIEERDTSPSVAGVSFTVWGRSKQALLSKPYSKTINDTDDTSHPWQSGNSTASAIVAHVVSNYCDYSVTVDWNAGDFAVYADSFSVSNQSPIDVISSLATVIGAELVANADGSLSIEAYSVVEGASVEDYNDLDDIVQLSESIDYPSGYNAVTVYGYGSGGSGTNATISAERVIEDEEADSNIYPGRNHTVRVYYYHSHGDTPVYSFPEGSCQQTGSGTESVTEDVRLIFGKGNTSKTNTDGETAVAGDLDIPITTVSVTYSVNYKDYALRGSEVATYNVLFYFADKSAYTIYSFPVTDSADSANAEELGVMEVDTALTGTLVAGGDCYIRVYRGSSPIHSMYNSGGTPIHLHDNNQVTKFTTFTVGTALESVTFTNGVGSLSYPYYTRGRSADNSLMRFKRHSKRVSIPVYPLAEWPSKYMEVCRVGYEANYNVYNFQVSHTSLADVVVWAVSEAGGVISTTVSVAERGSGDVVLNVSNWSSSANVAEVDIEVDGEWVGKSDSNGNVGINGLAKGDHTVKLTKDGYLQSDLDDIENSTFTVE